MDESFLDNVKHNEKRATAFANTMSYMQSRQGFGYSSTDLLAGFDWDSVETVVDIGGSHGKTAADIVKNTKVTKCIVQDLPDVVAEAKEQVEEAISDRISFMAHDFFKEQPVKDADVYFFRWILHDWSDIRASSILRQLIPALKDGASVILQEMILPDPGVLPFYHEKTLR
jgi:hypothetical protein